MQALQNRGEKSDWRSWSAVDVGHFPLGPRSRSREQAHWPAFLSDAIRRMIEPDPCKRFASLGEAITAIRHRDIDIELATKLSQDGEECRQREEFLPSVLFAVPEQIARRKCALFSSRFFPVGADFPASGASAQDREWARHHKWCDQYGLLKEALVLLFAYAIINQHREPTVLTRIAKRHHGYKPEYYLAFRDALLETVADLDKGDSDGSPSEAWRKAIEPGLNYMINYRLESRVDAGNTARSRNATDTAIWATGQDD